MFTVQCTVCSVIVQYTVHWLIANSHRSYKPLTLADFVCSTAQYHSAHCTVHCFVCIEPQCTVNCPACIVPQCTLHCLVCTVAQCIVHCPVCTLPQFILHYMCALYHSALCTILCALYHSALLCVHCTIVHCSLCSVPQWCLHFVTVLGKQCTVYCQYCDGGYGHLVQTLNCVCCLLEFRVLFSFFS